MVTLGCSPRTATLVAKEIGDWLVSVWVSTNLFGWLQGNSIVWKPSILQPTWLHISIICSCVIGCVPGCTL